ncbi:MAG: hypothetical protein HY952_05070 [Elusimicrobia bacterium]|nr:hypothetical protein [Elusimicrobiota bacterium]
MRIIPPLLVLACALPAFGQGAQEKRVANLEKRVAGVEKRVTRLENAGAAKPAAAAAAAAPAEPANPIAAVFVGKKQVVGKQLGIKLFVELENTGRRRYFAFNGLLVFRDENGAVIWSKAYGYGEPLLPGERIQVTLGVSSDQTKEYLKFVKAQTVTVALEKQEAYASD